MGLLADGAAASTPLGALADEPVDVPGEGQDPPRVIDGPPQAEELKHHRHTRRPERHRHRRHGEAEAPPEPGRAPAGHPFGGLPGPGSPPVSSVPPSALEGFRLPLFLLPVYQAAGLRYGVPWEVLAAINEVESDYGRNPTESSAGAVGWMQFMPATWSQWGVDANGDGMRDPADPVDAIYSSARYLQASGAETDLYKAVFAYNHADWYVRSVLLRARLIGAYPSDVVGTLSGIATARFPVAAPSRFATDHTSATVYSERGAPVVATTDGVVREIGRSRGRGRYVELEDAYGSRYVYSHLGHLESYHQVPRRVPRAADESEVSTQATALAAAYFTGSGAPLPPAFIKPRLFAHPWRRRSQAAGGYEQLLAAQGYRTYGGLTEPPLRLDPRYAVMKPLRRGSHVLASTQLGRLHRTGRPAMSFEIRPPGGDVAALDPRPVIETWEALARTRFVADRAAAVLMLPQGVLERRVLADPRVRLYRCGRRDIEAHRVDSRVLATLEYLAESNLDPTVTSLRCGHGRFTSSGNVSEHTAGAAVDVSAVNGVPILGNQQPGGVADRTVRRLMLLQGDARPHQIISLLSLGANTMALSDHADHVHVGFHPEGAPDAGTGALGPGEWDLLGRALSVEQQPVVPSRASRWALAD